MKPAAELCARTLEQLDRSGRGQIRHHARCRDGTDQGAHGLWQHPERAGVAIAVRKALTKGFRPAFNATEKKFADSDKLMRQFRKTAAGRDMADAWSAARLIKDAGHGGSGEPEPPVGGGGGTAPLTPKP